MEARRALVVAAFAIATVAAACDVFSRGPSQPLAPAARRYRDATKHSPTSVRWSRHGLDWANKPALYRTYPGAELVPLPSPRPLAYPALDAMAAPALAPLTTAAPLDLQLLATVLFLAGGITGTQPDGGDVRATAAAGALYPNELYAVTADLPGLPAGVYHYEPDGEHLSRLRAGDWRAALAAAADDLEIRRAPVTLVLSGILWRSAWKYQERAYRHLHWDGGMMLAHVLAAATGAGLPATVLAAFVDVDVDRLLGADGQGEGTLALVRLGAPVSPAPSSTEVPPLALRPTPLSPHPIDYPEALRYHAASKLADVAAVRALRRARPRPRPLGAGPEVVRLPPPASARGDATLAAVVRRRRSPRQFARRPIAVAELAAVLERPATGASADFLRAQPTLLETYVIVNAVDDLDPGAYHYRRDAHALEPLRPGNHREAAEFLCLEQALARDASVVIYYLADLDGLAAAFGERGYRLAELEAGLVAGRACLVAQAVGRGATGLTFYDDEVTRFFSPHAAALEPLLAVAVGVPARARR